MTVPYSEAEIDSADYKDIKFRIGIHKRTFVKNVVAIGLSSGFIEPLESNGLFTTHEFLLKLVKTLRRGHVSQIDRDGYNMSVRGMFNSFAEFVASHYALSARDDTKYWKDISKKQFKVDIENLRVEPYTGIYDMLQRRMFLDRFESSSGLHCIATGLNYFPIYEEDLSAIEFYDRSDYKEYINKIIEGWNAQRDIYQQEANESKLLIDFLKERIYEE